MNNTNDSEQLVRGMLYFAVLAVLERQENYGARILLELKDTPFQTRAGTLYPLLTRMQESGLLSSWWAIKDGKPPLRIYSISDVGKAKLEDLREIMGQINNVLQKRLKDS